MIDFGDNIIGISMANVRNFLIPVFGVGRLIFVFKYSVNFVDDAFKERYTEWS